MNWQYSQKEVAGFSLVTMHSKGSQVHSDVPRECCIRALVMWGMLTLCVTQILSCLFVALGGVFSSRISEMTALLCNEGRTVTGCCPASLGVAFV